MGVPALRQLAAAAGGTEPDQVVLVDLPAKSAALARRERPDEQRDLTAQARALLQEKMRLLRIRYLEGLHDSLGH